MIFVTIGTTHFNDLIEAVDKWSEVNPGVNVLCQIGSGTYIPKNAKFFRFDKSLDSYIANSNVVVTHGGATVIDMIRRKKRFIACANTALSGDHQTTMLNSLSKFCDLIWTSKPNEVPNLLDSLLENAENYGCVNWSGPSLEDDLVEYVCGLGRKLKV